MNNFLTCPADCDEDLLLGAIDVEQDCTNYKQYRSQITDVVITPDGATSPIAVAGHVYTLDEGEIDNTNEDNTKSKHLVGEGEVPAPEKQVDEYPKFKDKTTLRTYALNFTIKNLSDSMYDLLLQMQCGWTGFTFHYFDEAYGYGPDGGIEPKSVDVDFPRGGGRTDKQQATLVITWDADGDPPRGNTVF